MAECCCCCCCWQASGRRRKHSSQEAAAAAADDNNNNNKGPRSARYLGRQSRNERQCSRRRRQRRRRKRRRPICARQVPAARAPSDNGRRAAEPTLGAPSDLRALSRPSGRHLTLGRPAFGLANRPTDRDLQAAEFKARWMSDGRWPMSAADAPVWPDRAGRGRRRRGPKDC